jgi:uncharacterized alkaline shock family protein YloU
MDNDAPARGRTTIAPDVLLTIARLSALSVPGVVRMAPVPVAVDRLFKRLPDEGVRIEVRQMAVVVDLYLVMQPSADVHEVGRTVQDVVARAIQEMVGMNALAVNVHVEDIDYQEPPAAPSS